VPVNSTVPSNASTISYEKPLVVSLAVKVVEQTVLSKELPDIGFAVHTPISKMATSYFEGVKRQYPKLAPAAAEITLPVDEQAVIEEALRAITFLDKKKSDKIDNIIRLYFNILNSSC
jgi:hypothetical protein